MIHGNRVFRFACAAAMIWAVACAKEQSESYDRFEDMSLEAWIKQHEPLLLENKQEFGSASYYIDVLDAGDPTAAPVNDTVCWVKFDFSGRDLGHRIVLTRRASEAMLAGTFTKYTHYVPYYRYCGTENASLPEATYLAMRNVQTLGEAYFEKYKDDPERRLVSREVLLRKGAKVVLYCPSRVSGDISGTGGYEGQYSLESGKPVRIEMTICDTVKNPLAAEGAEVDGFCQDVRNGGLRIYSSDEDAADGRIPLPDDPKDANHPYNVPERWTSVCDSVPQLYADYRYKPQERFEYPEPYAVGIAPYVAGSSMAEIDRRIADTLLYRFHGGDASAVPDVRTLDADSVGLSGKAKIWYIGRFLDGFIFDTNIDEVKKIIYGEVKKEGSALEYTPESGGAVQSWYYTVPRLKFGQWAAVVSVSTHAYGAQGKQGSTETTVSSTSNGYAQQSYYDYLNFLNYANSYYGSSYGGYYGDYYGGYMGGYYNPYYSGYMPDYGDTGSDSTVTTSSTYTEVLPFTPLLFQIYVEPAED